jgi:hypothetical protein
MENGGSFRMMIISKALQAARSLIAWSCAREPEAESCPAESVIRRYIIALSACTGHRQKKK